MSLPFVFVPDATVHDAKEPRRIGAVCNITQTLHIYHRATLHPFQWSCPHDYLIKVVTLTADWCIVLGTHSLWIIFYTLPVAVAGRLWDHQDPMVLVWGQCDIQVPSVFTAVVHCSHFTGLIVIGNIGITHISTLAPLFYSFAGDVCPCNTQLAESSVIMSSFASPDTVPPMGVHNSKTYIGAGAAEEPITNVKWRQLSSGVSGIYTHGCTVSSFALDYDESLGILSTHLPVYTYVSVHPYAMFPTPIKSVSLISNCEKECVSVIVETRVVTLTCILDIPELTFFEDPDSHADAPIRITQLPPSETPWTLATYATTTAAENSQEAITIASCGPEQQVSVVI